MIDYSKGKIYKIICNITEEIYIGSTCVSLSQRLAGHKNNYKKWKNGKNKKKTNSFDIIDRNNYSIILLEDYPCNNKEKLLQKEREWIEKLECLNKKLPIISKEEKIDSSIKFR